MIQTDDEFGFGFVDPRFRRCVEATADQYFHGGCPVRGVVHDGQRFSGAKRFVALVYEGFESCDRHFGWPGWCTCGCGVRERHGGDPLLVVHLFSRAWGTQGSARHLAR